MGKDEPSPVRLVAIALDAAVPAQLAAFWARALRWDITEHGRGVELVPTDATSFRVVLQPVTNEKVGANRIHFDLTTASLDDQRDTVTELVEIGASHIDIGQRPDEGHVVLADPDGNELCIIEPQNRFLASCPRLGAVNCDGTRALGHFYSQALGWPLVWDQDEETAIQAPDGTGPKITWSGPPLMPKPSRERFHFHLAPADGATVQSVADHLAHVGATPSERHVCPGAVGLADVDGNDFCLVAP